MKNMNNLHPDLAALCQSYGVASLYVFGSRGSEMASRVRGGEAPASSPESDVDVAVHPVPGGLTSPRERVELTQALETLLGVRRVDLIMLPECDAFLAADAIRGELLYCDDADRQAREELYVLARAGDLAPFQRARLDGILSGELRR